MATNVEELVIKFTADISGLRGDLQKVEAQMSRTATHVENASKKMGAAFAGLRRFLSVGVIIGAAAALIRMESELEKTANDLEDVAKRANISVEALQRLRIVAAENGASAESLDAGLIHLQKSLGGARSGAKELTEIFEALGLKRLVTENASTEQSFYALADAISEVKDKSLAAKVLNDLLGRSGDELAGVFEGGSTALRAYVDAVEAARIASEELNHKLAESAEETKRTNDVLVGVGNVLAGWFVDALRELSHVLDGLILLWNDFYAAVKRVLDLLAEQDLSPLPPGLKGKAAPQTFVRGGAGLLGPGPAAPVSQFSALSSPFFSGVDQSKLRKLNEPGGGDSEAKRRAKAIQDVVTALNLEAAAFGRSAVAQRIAEELDRAGIDAKHAMAETIGDLVIKIDDLTVAQQRQSEEQAFASMIGAEASQTYDLTRTYAEQLAASIEKVNQQLEFGFITAETYNRAIEQIKGTFVDWSEINKEVGDSVASAFEEAIFSGNSLREVIAGLIEDLGRLIFQQLVFNQISSVVAGIVGGRQHGGGVNPGNRYMVGESGPELFVPKVAGNIVPNNRLGGGGSSFVFAPILNAQGANPATIALMRQMLGQARDDWMRMVPKFIQDRNARGALKFA